MRRVKITLVALALCRPLLFAADSPVPNTSQTAAPVSSPKKLNFDFSNHHGTFSQAELNSKPEVLVLTDEATAVLAKLKAFNASNSLKFAGAAKFLPLGGEFTGADYDGPTVMLDSNDHELYFDLDGKLKYYSSLEFHKSCTTFEPTTKISRGSKWSSDRALEIGQGYIRTLYNTSSVILSDPKVRYQPPEADMGAPARVYPGFWTITWIRTDGHGHNFECDGVTMRISELWGLTDFDVALTLPYVAQSGTQISQQAAIKIAKASKPSFEMSSGEIENYAFMGAQLKIVQPNFQRGSTGRLAWIVFLRPTQTQKQPDNDQEVTVDAYNGKVVGGMLEKTYTSATER